MPKPPLTHTFTNSTSLLLMHPLCTTSFELLTLAYRSHKPAPNLSYYVSSRGPTFNYRSQKPFTGCCGRNPQLPSSTFTHSDLTKLPIQGCNYPLRDTVTSSSNTTRSLAASHEAWFSPPCHQLAGSSSDSRELRPCSHLRDLAPASVPWRV